MTPRSLERWVVSLTVAAIGAFATLRWWQWSRPARKLTTSRETTFLTSPARDDGTVDYAAVVRAEWCEPKSSEEDAAPLIARAAGFDPPWLSHDELAALPVVQHPFVEFMGWTKDHAALLGRSVEEFDEDDVASAFRRGESGDDDRVVCAWLDEVDGALEVAKSASRRPRYCEPWQGSLQRRLRTSYWHSWSWLATNGLALRAVRRAGEGACDAAWSDVDAAFRLARLLCAEPELSHQAVFSSAKGPILAAASTVAQRTRATSDAMRSALSSAREGPPLATLRRAIARSQRLIALDFLNGVLRREERSRQEPYDVATALALQPDHAYRRLEARFDRIEAACADDVAWDASIARLRELHDETQTGERTTFGRFVQGPERVVDMIVDSITSSVAFEFAQVLQWVVECVANDEATVAEIAALVAARQTGREPTTTDDLTPLVFASPFRDRLTQSPLRLRCDATGDVVADGPVIDLMQKILPTRSRTELRSRRK